MHEIIYYLLGGGAFELQASRIIINDYWKNINIAEKWMFHNLKSQMWFWD